MALRPYGKPPPSAFQTGSLQPSSSASFGLQASVSFALLSKMDGMRTELKGEIQQVKTSIDETNKRIDEIQCQPERQHPADQRAH